MDVRELENLREMIRTANEEIKTQNIKGKLYAGVNERVAAFRKVYPCGRITTKCVQDEGGRAVFIAEIFDGEGRLLATGTAFEKQDNGLVNKTSYIENCETSAVGRALGFAGFGIVASIASADEVINAKEQQQREEKITKNEATVLFNLIDSDDNRKVIFDTYGVDSFEEMTRGQYADAVVKYARFLKKGKTDGK